MEPLVKLPPYPKSREIWAYRIHTPMCQACKELKDSKAIFTTLIDGITHMSLLRDSTPICKG